MPGGQFGLLCVDTAFRVPEFTHVILVDVIALYLG
jgi:hypothetical protein